MVPPDDQTPVSFASMTDSEKSAAREISGELIGSGGTPLHAAAAFGHIEFARKCIADGFDVNAVNSKGKTAMFYAAKYKRIEVVRLLLDAGAAPRQVAGAGVYF